MDISELKIELIALVRALNADIQKLEEGHEYSAEQLKSLSQQAAKIQERSIQLEFLYEIEKKRQLSQEEESIAVESEKKQSESRTAEQKEENIALEAKDANLEKDERKEETQPNLHHHKNEELNEENSKPDLNEVFSLELDPSLSGQLKKQPIADLLTAIGLNERYLYANELFGGNMEEFKESIRILNECENREEARSVCFDRFKKEHGWEEDNELFQALMNLIERRFQ